MYDDTLLYIMLLMSTNTLFIFCNNSLQDFIITDHMLIPCCFLTS